MSNLLKAKGFFDANNFEQTLRVAELSLTKLKLLKDRPLEALDEAFALKTTSLITMGRHREAMENAKERYSLWAMTNIRNPNSIWAAFDLIDCCLHLDEFVDAELFARTAYEIINEKKDNIIPLDQRQQFLARGAHYLAQATYELAKAGGIAPEAKQAAGVKAIALIREALEIDNQLYEPDAEVAANLIVLADALEYFNDVDDDEVLRLYEKAKALYAREQGSSSLNVAVGENNLGLAYHNRALRAEAAHDLERAVANLELALPRLLEAVRIYRTNHVENANNSLLNVSRAEEKLRQIQTLIAATTRTAGAGASER